MTAPDLLSQVELFHGELAPQRTSVFVRLLGFSTRNGWRLTGQIRGPFSVRGETLPATHPFLDQGPGDSILVKAVVPDPVLWSSDQPALYKVTLQLHEQGRQVATCERSFAFQDMHVSGKHFYRDGKAVVLRAASCERLHTAEDRSAATWLSRTEALACWVPAGATPPEDAGLQGLPLIVEMKEPQGSSDPQILSQLKELTQQPAIMAVVLSPSAGAIAKASKWPHNLLLGCRILADEPWEVPDWAEFVLLDLDQELSGNPGEVQATPRLNAALQCPLPVIVIQSIPNLAFSQLRPACDSLQRRLAPWGQFSGYFVG